MTGERQVTMSKLKALEYILYGLTAAYSFALAGFNGGNTGDVASYLVQRAVFYLIESVLLFIAMIRCGRLYSEYDDDYFMSTERIFAAADCCFVMIAIVTVFSVAGMLPIFVFLPERVFKGGAAKGLFVSLLVTGAIAAFYIIVTKKFEAVKKRRGEIKNPQLESLEEFYSFSNLPDEKEERPPEAEMPDAAALLDEAIPDEEEFAPHLQHISLINNSDMPNQLWECPFCGYLNPSDSEKCDFCGAEIR